ncbi:ethanolamine kinase [Bicyclus anynana]|uniref:ethanolamine kinase n=1 Tax=Bicyclus anynana TaxID=110368 RepID=A0A6J1P0A6_BICAN|nr:ethanolamine kinase [Bicyclus anynana]
MSRICDPAGHKYIPVEVEELDIYTGIYEILSAIRPEWPQGNIKFKVFTDGITNKLVACQLDSVNSSENNKNIVLVRIYGNKTDLLIDRDAEVRNITVLNKAGLAPKIYGVFKNGLSYEYYPGVTLTTETVTDVRISRLVARQMAKMHKIQLGEEIPKEPMVWDKIEQFLSLIPEKFTDANKHARFTNSFGSITRLRIEFERLKSHLIKTESPIVFAHNDLLLGNVIYNESKGTVSFIDYEYASYNYQAYDIANHFNEFVGISIDNMDYSRYPSKDFQMNWIRVYLAEYLDSPSPPQTQVEDIYKEVQRLSLVSHFKWGIWSLVQYELSAIDFDFGGYAEMRLNRYFEEKNAVFKELL